MKKTIAVLVTILFLLNMSLAYTVTVIIDGIGLQVTCDPGEEVKVLPKLEEIEDWEVESGGVTIIDNKFTMPENDVVIEGIINREETAYTITVIEDTGTEISGEYENYRCSQCGGLNHQCEIGNIFIKSGDAEVIEVGGGIVTEI